MSAELGFFALIMGFAVALLQSIVPHYGLLVHHAPSIGFARLAAMLQFSLIALAFLILTNSYIDSDFSLAVIYQNSHVDKPLLYKITGVWANHEGSMLLWVLILSLCGLLLTLFGSHLPFTFQARLLAIQGAIGAAFLAFIIFASNPFMRLDPVPIAGLGLNPLLQDIGLAFHPPLLYCGYVGLSISFCFAAAALLEGRIDSAWGSWIRPWVLAAWIFLTLGIAAGSWWAYYELGWGGFWFWDPVENASLMPWLAATALLHSVRIVEKRNALKVWSVLLAIICFSLSLIGTFLVRSGILTSVHAFATDPTRGFFILMILGVAIGGALSLFAWRAPMMKPGGVFANISRENALVANNLLLTIASFAVFIGTLAPLIYSAFGLGKITVGPPYFNLVFGIVFGVLLLLLPLGPLLSWKRAYLVPLMRKLWAPALAAGACAALTIIMIGQGAWFAPLGIALSFWICAGTLLELGQRIQLFTATLSTSRERLIGLPRSALGMSFAHFGLGLIVFGMSCTLAWRAETISLMAPGSSAAIAGFQVTYIGTIPVKGDNYRAEMGRFHIQNNDQQLAEITSERRIFTPGNQQTTEVGLYHHWRGDLYIALGEATSADDKSEHQIRIYFFPMISFLWGGALLMVIGGVFSLCDRRHRMRA